MAITLQRQITEDEKQRIIEIHGRRCYATGHEISKDEAVFFDHIKAFADGGPTSIDNIAPMCKYHNESKGRLPLEDFRIKLKLDNFFSQGQALTLRDELDWFKKNNLIKEFGRKVYIVEKDNTVIFENNGNKEIYPLHKCSTTGWTFFYATLPVEVINSDDDDQHEIGLQPRYLIFDKIFELYRHFQRHPVLQPSIARFSNNQILVFDGQHKIAALLWNNQLKFEVKVYLNPDIQLLNETNISAHDKYSQTRFYSSIMVAKLGSQFGKQFEDYRNLEDGKVKSEANFLRYLRSTEYLTLGEVDKKFISYLYDSVLNEDQNKLVRLVPKGNRGSAEYPLTIDLLSKSLLSNFLYRSPVEDDMTSKNYRREIEIQNVINLFNILDDELLFLWDGNKPESDNTQNKLNRMFRSKSIMSWSEILRDAISAKLEIFDADEKAMIFYRDLSIESMEKIKRIIKRLADWAIWNSPINSEIDRVLSDNKSEVKAFFKEKGLTVGYLLGAPE